MPVTRTARKALRQNVRRRAKNIQDKNALKKTVKEYRRLLSADPKKASAYLPTLFKTIDKSAKRNLIAKNRAGRLKSRLSRKLAEAK